MKVFPTSDLVLIKSILTSPGIWDEIRGEYFDDKNDFVPPDDPLYLVGRVDGREIGLFIVHKEDDDWNCHVQVMIDERKEHALEFGQKAVKWVFDNTDIKRLIAEIPNKFTNVQRFAKLQGFNVYYNDSDCCKVEVLKDGIC